MTGDGIEQGISDLYAGCHAFGAGRTLTSMPKRAKPRKHVAPKVTFPDAAHGRHAFGAWETTAIHYVQERPESMAHDVGLKLDCSHGWSVARRQLGGAQPVAARAQPVEIGRDLLYLVPDGGEGVLSNSLRSIMPGTYSQILLHIVFSTKRREPWITADIAGRLYPYMGGIVRAEKGVLYDIGGIEDHVHLYLRWRPDATVSDLMRTVKARSSKWVHDTFPALGAFAWQEGYGVFTVSKSQETVVKKYIARQAEHHKKENFKAELLRLLCKHEIEFEERYVFD